MHIDWISFTPASALVGGIVIGLAVSALTLLNGRILGVSGILGGLLEPHGGDAGWRIAFVAGLVSAPLLALGVFGVQPPVIDSGMPLALAAGLLVGVGTSLSAGCTSGHGICGLARLSPRSLVATALFMATGIATVFVVRHIMG